MAEVQFKPRYAISNVLNPDPIWLRDLILDPFGVGRVFGEASIVFSDNSRKVELIAITDWTLGYYLKYRSDLSEWLSLGDASRLSEVVCPDDWEASVGLFISPNLAWLAVQEFCRSGERSNEIRWIRPCELPVAANY
jgi:hypothetical protein